MKGLITNRTQENVARRAFLSAKGWQGMTVEERVEWSGDPFETTTANLIPYGPYSSSTVELKYKNGEIIATSTVAGTNLYAVSIIGKADKFANGTFTLSVDDIVNSSEGIPQLAVCWHDGNGYEFAGASVLGHGSTTFNTNDFPNTKGREYLALYVYITTNTTVEANTVVRFIGAMLNNGDTKSPYVPYTEVVATNCTKGAYNYSDLNRVERAVAEISELAGLDLATKTDWTMWDIPTASEMERYLLNIEAIKTYCGSNLVLPTTMDKLDYESANNIERIIDNGYDTATAGGS